MICKKDLHTAGICILILYLSGSFFGVYGIDSVSQITGKEFYRYTLLDSIDTDSLKSDTVRMLPKERSKLNRKGVIYRGVEINANSGAGIVSGLNLELNGMIYEDIEVSAYISDDRMALSQSGSTKEISDLEKIHIEFKHPVFMTRFGDYSYDYMSGEFGNINKEFAGVYIGGRNAKIAPEAFVSTENSEYRSVELMGIEGVSGPYVISENNTRMNVISGSETVYLNGKKLKRGSEYFFDHINSELYFKQNIPVSEGDRIIVDIRAAKESYKRIAYGTALKNRMFGGKLDLDIQYFREADEEAEPVLFELTGEIKDQMSEAGEVEEVSISGATFKEGEGDYDMLSDSTFVYAGQGEGDYDVRFSFCKDGGDYYIDYDSLGTVFFVYDGVNGGDYSPEIVVKTPGSYSRIHSRISYNNENFNYSSETVFSGERKNLYYDRPHDMEGFGDVHKIELMSDRTHAGIFSLELKRKNYNSRLKLPSRTTEPKKEEEIDHGLIAEDTGFLSYSGQLRHEYEGFLRSRISYSYSEYGDKIAEEGNVLDSEMALGRFFFKTEISKFVSDGSSGDEKKSTYYFSSGYRRDEFELRPYFRSVIFDSKEQDTEEYENKTYGNLLNYSKSPAANLSNRTEFESAERRQKFTNIFNISSFVGTVFNSDIVWTKVLNRFDKADSTDTGHDMVNIRANYNKNNDHRIFVEYQTEKNTFIPKVRSYYRVEEGTGSYVFRDGEYFPDEFGDYEFSTTYSDISKELTAVDLNVISFFDLNEKEINDNIGYWLSRFDIGQDIRIRERSTTPFAEDIILLNVKRFQNDSTVNGLIKSNTELHFLRREKNSFEYNYKYSKNISREFRNYSENNLFQRHFLSYKNISGNITGRLAGKISSKENYTDPGQNRTELIKKSSILYSFRHKFKRGYDYGFVFEYGSENEKEKDINSDSYKITPSFSAELLKNGILRVRGDVIRIYSDKALPYSMQEGAGEGWSYKWDVFFDLSFSSSMSGDLVYRGRKLSTDKRSFHELRLEIRMEL
ncbi:MAG: hypothetical protein R6V47_04570 [Candidatus Delongbacteria bacterium]